MQTASKSPRAHPLFSFLAFVQGTTTSSSPLFVRLRLFILCLLGLYGLHLVRGDLLASGYVPLPEALSRHGLSARNDEASVLSVQRRGTAPQWMVFRAIDDEREPGDVWVGKGVLSPDGRVAALSGLHNLTRTSSADESSPVVMGSFAMFTRRVDGEVVAIELLDLDGEPPSDQGLLARVQRGITNLQQTGTWSGIGRRSYVLRAPAHEVAIRNETDVFLVTLDGVQRAVISPAAATPREGANLFEVRTHATVVVELVPWLVDTVRALPFVGAEKIAWLENKVFALRDRVKQAYYSVSGTDHEAEVAEELGVSQVGSQKQQAQEERVERLSVPNPESGWPPPALDPLASPEVPGEGKWRAIIDDPHARTLPNGAPVFYQTFLRSDAQRTYVRVYLTVWDPRLVQLNMVAGTEEPVSATGEAGTGTIPRDPSTMKRLVAAFNGGFQAVHGEFGMMASGRVYLPPKPWAATVAVYNDGRVALGSWPGPKDRKASYDEARAVAEIPADMVAFRQNLTTLVEDGTYNPWGRWWWGAAPNQKGEQTLTQRSALCMTRDGFMIYAWGDSLSPDALGQALVSARCVRAMHLDMNSSHCGMELYNVLKPDEPALPVGKKEKYRFDGVISGLPGYTVRARKAVTSMGTEIPRYIKPDPRDYFYLTLKPGIETVSPAAGTLTYKSADLPHAGWPPAFARASVPKGRVIRIDPARAIPNEQAATGAEVVLAELRGNKPSNDLEDQAVYVVSQLMGVRYAVGVAPQEARVLARGPSLARMPEAKSALGVDADGLLVYAELDDDAKGQLSALLKQAGVDHAVAFRERVRLGLHFREGVLAADGSTRLREGTSLLRFVATSTPAVEVLFPDTKPMPYGRWAMLQDQRVRYKKSESPSAKAPPGSLK